MALKNAKLVFLFIIEGSMFPRGVKARNIIGTCFVLVHLVVNLGSPLSLFANPLGSEPIKLKSTDPSYHPPSVSGSIPALRSRYLEEEWRHLNKEKRDDLLLEKSLKEQFGKDGLPLDFGKHSYHESPVRRFQIVFFLSLPITALFTYGIWRGSRYIANPVENRLTAGESAGVAGIGAVLSGLIGWYDYYRVKRYQPSPTSIPGSKTSFLFKTELQTIF